MKRLFALCALILLGFGSRAQITYHDIVPDSTIGGGPTLTFWVLQPPTSSAQLHIFWSMNNTVFLRIHGSFGFGEMLMTGGFPAKLPAGADISTASVTWAETTGANGSLNESGNGNWRSDAADKYLGFRFKTMTGHWTYGWLKMTVATGGTSFTVKEWGIQTTEGVGIRAGDRPPTSIQPIQLAPQIQLSVFNGRLYPFHLEQGRDYAYRVTDMQGRTISNGNIRADGSLPVSGMASGMYVIQLVSGGYDQRLKFVVPQL
ncbi:T9SS type A sorting domain-containing protein [Taibaiella chishuiensis]|uniref:Putative secreted protein (Por secretion system target) n=1 Tax=Taibaiella chishuiensis TaxID=1434707 RepID=A0A2P8DCV3_9BACT|nr:T9SS type A sorting domain-containing protein [Taibaiella chishuiensis]PSK95051.1 putative secreted protein (Por secretion system target) [Taibaiella chishuiensis]